MEVIDQRFLPHEWVVVKLHTYQETETAIKDMIVRGAPLIGATAAYGIYLAAKEVEEKSCLLAIWIRPLRRWRIHDQRQLTCFGP